MCPPNYRQTGFAATRKSVHTIYGYTLLVFKNERVLKLLQEKRAKSKMVKYDSSYKMSAQEVAWTISEIYVYDQETQCVLPFVTTLVV